MSADVAAGDQLIRTEQPADDPAEDVAKRAERRTRARQWAMLACAVLAILLPTALLQPHSQLFLLKLAVAGLLGFIPGWLYLQFIKFKGRGLYDEFVLNLFRLHIDEIRNLPAPPKHTGYYLLWRAEHNKLKTESTDNLYRRKFEAIYGRHSVSTRGLLPEVRSGHDRTETFSPVLVATVLLCIGWVLVVQPEVFRSFDLLGGRQPSGGPAVPYDALRFGFIGAYWFIIQDLVRRYFRDDLKTGAYISASVRIIIVTLVVATVGLLPSVSARQQAILAFFIGIFPQIGVQVLKAGLTRAFGGLVPTMRSDYPLSDLDGLSIWDQARLLEEGIEDMQNLVSANLVDVMLRSRVPITRLVDWLDQACLAMRLPVSTKKFSALKRLRAIGIRSATDLEGIWRSPLRDDKVFRGQFERALSVSAGTAPTIMQAILVSLKSEVNLHHVRQFKKHQWLQRDTSRTNGGGPPPGTNGQRQVPDHAPN
jgi:hypothetical protein